MFTLRPIQSLDPPELAPYRTMRRPLDHVRQGVFVAEGEKVVRRMLAHGGIGVVSALLADKWAPKFEAEFAAHPAHFDVFTASTELLEQLVGFHLYQGVLAVGKIPPPPSLDAILAASAPPRLFVAADGLTNSQNVGVLVRNCAAFNAQALLVGETCASPWLRRAVRNSMGAVFHLPVHETDALAATLQRVRAAGLRLIAAHPHTDRRTIAQADLTGDCCLVMGSEGDGLRSEVLALCDEAVAIPMAPTVDSLNVTSATAVFLYEASRQRGRM